MNENWPAELKEQLLHHKAELTDRITRIKADLVKTLERDSSEQATQLENRDVLNALAKEGTHELAEVNAALQRMGDGTYGDCRRCGNPISAGRLKARPYSIECIDCASA